MLWSLGASGVAVVDDYSIRATEATGRKDGLDEAAFRALYDRTARPLWGYVARATGNDALADDLVQEAYFRLLRADFVPESEEHAKNYLFRIATNLIRDHFRGAGRAQLPLEHEPGVLGHERQVHLQHDLRRAMLKLKPRERELLWLGHVERFSHKEIAEILGLKAGSIRLLLFRARKKLASLLEEADAGSEEGR
jgi:RNA polymerase sigma-70 factor (ECF subfamily)